MSDTPAGSITPATSAPVMHGCPADAEHDRESPEVDLFSPLTIRGVTFRNRVVMSPMCQYCARRVMADDWHLVHLGSRAVGGGPGRGRGDGGDARRAGSPPATWGSGTTRTSSRWPGSPGSSRARGPCAGIQLAHAGRKASCDVPWNGGASLKTPEEGGWTVVGPSPIPFSEGDPVPVPLDEAGIDAVVAAFEAAAVRRSRPGFRVIEIHSAHGYLLHEFLSPLSNHREDQYGRQPGEPDAAGAPRRRATPQRMPQDLPLFVRISATDWAEGGWDVDQSVVLAGRLKDAGRRPDRRLVGRMCPRPASRSARDTRSPSRRRSATRPAS